MWYVVRVGVGKEHKINSLCRAKIPREILRESFIPAYEKKCKVQGIWEVQKKALFPGYLFMSTDDVDGLRDALNQIPGFTKVLGTGCEPVPLSEEEVMFLRKIGGDAYLVEISEGIIENSVTIIQSGPLKGLEANIRKIDRHKRRAYLEVEMFGRKQRVEVGLEIFSKT